MSMEIGVCVAGHIGDIAYAIRAEELGYGRLWFADRQASQTSLVVFEALEAAGLDEVMILPAFEHRHAVLARSGRLG